MVADVWNRARVMMNAVRLLRDRNQELADLETLDTGKPIQEIAAVGIISGADSIEYFPGLASSRQNSVMGMKEKGARIRKEDIPKVKKPTPREITNRNVEKGSVIPTDELNVIWLVNRRWL